MTELKCPICKKELRPLAIGWCCDCGMCGDKELWQALIDTKKKLDIAVDSLKRIADAPIGYCMFAEEALEQIKDKEQQ